MSVDSSKREGATGTGRTRQRLVICAVLSRNDTVCADPSVTAMDGHVHGTDHHSHKEQGSMIRRYIIWRNRHADDVRLRQFVVRANVA